MTWGSHPEVRHWRQHVLNWTRPSSPSGFPAFSLLCAFSLVSASPRCSTLRRNICIWSPSENPMAIQRDSNAHSGGTFYHIHNNSIVTGQHMTRKTVTNKNWFLLEVFSPTFFSTASLSFRSVSARVYLEISISTSY